MTEQSNERLLLTDEMRERIDSRGDQRLDSYYFFFEPTENEHIDRILGAVALAGKYAHSTEWWGDDSMIEGHTLAELIQAAANTAAGLS